jgi:GNAT superfamily N-acetyltransferase
MSITIREVSGPAIEALFPILLQAEGSERALRWSLANLVDAVYQLEDDGHVVAAITMQWRNDPCEIMELAVAEELHGRGYGRQLVAWVVEEARQRGKSAILVGTANSSLGNIAFYQKCGFRMDHVRKDFFWYYREPIYEHGLRVLDMLVFCYELHRPAEAA